jgi:hypothetical protein
MGNNSRKRKPAHQLSTGNKRGNALQEGGLTTAERAAARQAIYDARSRSFKRLPSKEVKPAVEQPKGAFLLNNALMHFRAPRRFFPAIRPAPLPQTHTRLCCDGSDRAKKLVGRFKSGPGPAPFAISGNIIRTIIESERRAPTLDSPDVRAAPILAHAFKSLYGMHVRQLEPLLSYTHSTEVNI